MENHSRCSVGGCDRPARSGTSPYCEMHYYRLRRNGSLKVQPRLRLDRYNHGYIVTYAPDHPLSKRHRSNYEYQHRIVFYDAHGPGPFKCHWCGNLVTWDGMHVDHLNGITDDNRLENLVASCPACNQGRGKAKMVTSMRDRYGMPLEYNGQRKTLGEWADAIGITRASLAWRLKHGWTLDRALNEGRGRFGPPRKTAIEQRQKRC